MFALLAFLLFCCRLLFYFAHAARPWHRQWHFCFIRILVFDSVAYFIRRFLCPYHLHRMHFLGIHVSSFYLICASRVSFWPCFIKPKCSNYSNQSVFNNAVSILYYLAQIFIAYARKAYIRILQSFMWVSIFWFWELFILNLCFIYSDALFLKPIALLSSVICIYLSYRYIYHVIIGQDTIKTLERIAYRDELTKLRSRVAFYDDAAELLQLQKPFSLVFIDLDQFKSINDNFGHNIGDEYLAFFAGQVQQRLGKGGHLYRISGDEFVCIFQSGDIFAFIDSLSGLPTHLPRHSDVKFLGFSYGIAEYPKDGTVLEELLQASDQRMYANKNAKYIINDRRKKK